MNAQRSFYRNQSAGFSIVELMVGMVVALLTTVVIFRSYQAYEGQRRTVGAASDLVANAQYVVSHLNREMSQSGWGFQFGKYGVGCDFSSQFSLGSGQNPLDNASYPVGRSPAERTMMPVLIADGGSASGVQSGSDMIRIMYGNATQTIAYKGAAVGATFQATSAVGYQRGDMALLEAGLGSGTPNCQLVQVTNTPVVSTPTLSFATGVGPCEVAGVGTCTGSVFNSASLITTPNRINNLGALTVNTYYVSGNNLMLRSAILGNTYRTNGTLNTDSGYISSNSSSVQVSELSPDIVNIQAQYGIDATADGESQVESWVNATGNFATDKLKTDSGSSGFLYAQQIRAIRYLVVSRSAVLENKRDGSGNCTATNTTTEPSATKTLKWPNGDTIKIDLTQGATASTWRCYRYKFYMDVVPMRNMIWNGRDYESAAG